jgi:hypothetical protein
MIKVTVEDIKRWSYYSHKAINFPRVPLRISNLIQKAGRIKGYLEVKDDLDITSLNSFKRRVSNYENSQLNSQGIPKFVINNENN